MENNLSLRLMGKYEKTKEFILGTFSFYGVIFCWIGLAMQNIYLMYAGISFIISCILMGVLNRVDKGISVEDSLIPMGFIVYLFICIIAIKIGLNWDEAKLNWILYREYSSQMIKNSDSVKFIWTYIDSGLMGVLITYTFFEVLSFTGNIMRIINEEQKRRILALEKIKAENINSDFL